LTGNQCEIRYAEVVSEAQDAIAEAETEVSDGEKKLADAKEELEDGWEQLADAKKEVSEGQEKLAEILYVCVLTISSIALSSPELIVILSPILYP